MSAEKEITVIVTDDHSLFRMGVKNGLNRYPNIKVVAEAANGQELLERLEKFRPDIVTLNIQMPIMDGLATMPIIRQRYPGQKVIVISMHNDPTIVLRMIELGANSYLTKECGSEEIYKTIMGCQQQWLFITRIMLNAFADTMEKLAMEPSTPLDNLYSHAEQLFIRFLLAGNTLDEMPGKMRHYPKTVAAIYDKLRRRTNCRSMEELKLFFEKTKPQPITTPTPG